MAILQAPWTTEQVQALNSWQTSGVVHPFTCGNGSHVLRATPEGWVCDECMRLGRSYTQDWCHDFQAEGKP
jgi:hypothetical protein